MNKRQKKKMLSKCLPVIADEYNLMTMTEAELQSAIADEKKYRLKYGYRKKYSNLKNGKFLRYFYPTGKEYSDSMSKLQELFRTGESTVHIVTQTRDQLL